MTREEFLVGLTNLKHLYATFYSKERLQRVRNIVLTPIIVIVANIGFTSILPSILGALR